MKGRLILLLALYTGISSAQNKTDVYVDRNGVMRWPGNNTEVVGFGVNYTVPFAHAYRASEVLNVSPEKAIDEDVYHFARLNLDLYRIHVWDVEISDSAGNLLNNRHLQLFDYLIKKLKDRGIRSVLTPIAFTGSGYPESDKKAPGFTAYYGGKANCLVNPDAIKAEERYLIQFLNHVNPYTGIAYKNDPDIIAYEVCNEPHHKGTVEKTKTFVNRLVKAMRSTGCKKPIFYNMSHSVHLADAYINADVQGGTFQWYPSGLVGNEEVKGNFLPHVDKYPIPFAENPKFKKMAKIVYELDPADIGRSYIFPAMARSFREAGIQIATQFAWDPLFLAYANSSYQTHYVNLAYAPQKALSLLIASEVFHKVPMYKSFGRFPVNNSFDDFRVDYEKDLAEMINQKKFIYTNNTTSLPPSPATLEEIAGFGNSPVIKYEGSGAYFLDKLADGVWRLEVMPDAIPVRDPFERANFQKHVTVIDWKQWPMTINLPDLADGFHVNALNNGNTTNPSVNAGTFMISPGAYLLIRKGTAYNYSKTDKWKNRTLNEFVAPAPSVNKLYVLHTPATSIPSGKPHTVNAKIAGSKEADWAQLIVYDKRFPAVVMPMQKTNGYDYTAVIPDSLTTEGYLNYYITVKTGNDIITYPSEINGQPTNWDYYDKNSYRVPLVSSAAPIYLFSATSDIDQMTRHFSYIYAGRQWVTDSYVKPADEGNAELVLDIDKLFTEDPEYRTREKIYDRTFRQYAGNKIADRIQDIPKLKELVLKGHAITDKPCKVQLALVMKDGSAYGGIIDVNKDTKEYRLSLSALQPVKYVLMPRPYPTFLPYYFDNTTVSRFDLGEVESLQVSIGPGILPEEINTRKSIAIESIRLQ